MPVPTEGSPRPNLVQRIVRIFDPVALRIVAPLFPLLLLLPWLWRQVANELTAPLFRDAAIVQYTGWCIRHGLRLYQDAATPDGPFIHFFHAALQVVWGITDSGARRGDLIVHLLGASAIGFVLAPRPPSSDRRTRESLRVVWTLLGAFAWLPWYLTGGWEHTVQRDPLYALVGYLGMSLVYASGRFGRRAAMAAAFGGGLLVTVELFTRQSGVIYPALALLGLLVEGRASPHWKARLGWGFAGAGAALALMFGLLLLFGSVPGFFFWYFTVPFDVYRFIGAKPPWWLATHPYRVQLAVSVAIALLFLAAIIRRILSPRAAGFALAPFLFLVAACLAGKGWPNHVQQTTAATSVILLLLLSETWERGLERGVWGRRLAGMAIVLVGVFVARVGMNLRSSIFNNRLGSSASRIDAEQVARDLERDTGPDDRVFYYAHEMHGLLFAERKPALPMISDQVLDFAAWLHRAPPTVPMTDAQLATFDRTQGVLFTDACRRLLADPPAAVVSAQNDLKTWSVVSFQEDLAEICPAFRPLLISRYRMHPVAGYHVYIRTDLPPR
jgi:hypothetical protein